MSVANMWSSPQLRRLSDCTAVVQCGSADARLLALAARDALALEAAVLHRPHPPVRIRPSMLCCAVLGWAPRIVRLNRESSATAQVHSTHQLPSSGIPFLYAADRPTLCSSTVQLVRIDPISREQSAPSSRGTDRVTRVHSAAVLSGDAKKSFFKSASSHKSANKHTRYR
jgi:hypothetical protein